MEYHGRQWHDSCFCCCVCKNTIGSNSFIPKNDDIYCKCTSLSLSLSNGKIMKWN